MKTRLAGMSRTQLRLWVFVFFCAFALPTGLLGLETYEQLKWQAFHRQRLLAEEFTTRIDAAVRQLVDEQEALSFADFSFLTLVGDTASPGTNVLQRSKLAQFPPANAWPGIVGYFQIDAGGSFSSPLLPSSDQDADSFGISSEEYAKRRRLETQIQSILAGNQILERELELESAAADTEQPSNETAAEIAEVSKRLSELERQIGALRQGTDDSATTDASTTRDQTPVAQAYFDSLSSEDESNADSRSRLRSLGRTEDLALDESLEEKAVALTPPPLAEPQKNIRATRKERYAAPESLERPSSQTRAESAPASFSIRVFESELEPFSLSFLASGHLVLHRNVWRDKQRYIQGALIDFDKFADALVATQFARSLLGRNADLALSHAGSVVKIYPGKVARGKTRSAIEISPPSRTVEYLTGTLLYRARLSAPAAAFELIFHVQRLPLGPSANFVAWLALTIFCILVVAAFLAYRMIAKQIDLARQQQDFIAAVSHELKTPLTSIRMYGEMLKSGWASEERKQTYYSFIFDESERLSRLIDNVLHLSRMSRTGLSANLRTVPLSELMATVSARVEARLSDTGFQHEVQCTRPVPETQVELDEDFLNQILINLLDNAIKFSADAATKRVEIDFDVQVYETRLSVRDYGPGIATDQMKQIFRLFYRSENELTRETVGTGIGLALVQQLADAMKARIEVSNAEPGARFVLRLRNVV